MDVMEQTERQKGGRDGREKGDRRTLASSQCSQWKGGARERGSAPRPPPYKTAFYVELVQHHPLIASKCFCAARTPACRCVRAEPPAVDPLNPQCCVYAQKQRQLMSINSSFLGNEYGHEICCSCTTWLSAAWLSLKKKNKTLVLQQKGYNMAMQDQYRSNN